VPVRDDPRPATTHREARRRFVVPFGALALLLPSIVVAVSVGSTDLTFVQVARSVGAHLGWGTSPLRPLADSVVWDLRLPRALLAAAVGAGLGVCGVVLQSVTRNVLAEPYLLGVSSGASTGAVVVVVLGWGGGLVGQAAGAFAGGLAAFALVIALSGPGTATALTRVVLTGVAVGQLASALTSLVLTVSGDAEAVRGLTFWLLGSLGGARWTDVALCASVVVVGALVCWTRAAALDAFTFGADAAAALGIPVATTRTVLLVVTALMTAVVVATCGAVGFVGLVLPHLVRRFVGAGHRLLLPSTAVVGAVFLVWVDVFARTVFAPQEVPVGVVTALIGVPVFLVVVRSRRGSA